MFSSCRNICRSSRAFTLMEVLVAAAIFSISTTAIFTAFNIGTQAFETGKEATVTLQSLRFTMDMLTNDLRATYYRPDYDKRFDDLEKAMAKNSTEVIERLERESALSGNREEPGFVGLKQDLRFRGQPQDKLFSHIAFARFTVRESDGDLTSNDWGAVRVHYFVSGSQGHYNLYRQVSPLVRRIYINANVEEEVLKAADRRMQLLGDSGEDPLRQLPVNPRDLIGLGLLSEELEAAVDVEYLTEKSPEARPPELIAENVEGFEVFFGYYSDGEWVETKSWDSQARVMRSPAFSVSTEDPDFLMKLLSYLQRPTDGMPSYVRIKLALRHVSERTTKATGRKTADIETIVWMPNAQENYVAEDAEYYASLEPVDETEGED